MSSVIENVLHACLLQMNDFHSFCSQGNSSKRTRHAAEILHTTGPRQIKNGRRRKTRAVKKLDFNLMMATVNRDKLFLTEEQCSSKKHCFQPSSYALHSDNACEYHHTGDLEVLDTLDGVTYSDDMGKFVFTLVPRKENLASKSRNSLVKQLRLMKNLVSSNRAISRSDSRKGFAEKEVSVGIKASRNHHGFHVTVMDESLWNMLRLYLKQTDEHVAKKCTSESLLAGICAAKKAIGWPGMEGGEMWTAISASLNCHSGVHTDPDFFASIVQVVAEAEEGEYKLESDVVTHFCFPTHGLAVALRNGDMLLFNPCVPHCCSKQEKKYENVDVYMNSFYLKTNVVGLNDNRIPFNLG